MYLMITASPEKTEICSAQERRYIGFQKRKKKKEKQLPHLSCEIQLNSLRELSQDKTYLPSQNKSYVQGMLIFDDTNTSPKGIEICYAQEHQYLGHP